MTNPNATPQELFEIRQLDPQRIEGWQHKQFGAISGIEFTFLLPYARRPAYFKFLAVKESASRWWICPLYPNMDMLGGHQHHMITRTINGVSLPALCGPEGRSASSLVEVREIAAKWSHYIAQLLSGQQPGFSE